MSRKKIFHILVILMVNFFNLITLHAATYYMPDDCANLQVCFGTMSGGDELIIRDGIYTGSSNMISTYQKPPAGTDVAYTIVSAEHPGKVVFDGEMANRPVLIYGDGDTAASTIRYVEFHGLIWKNSSSNVVAIYGAAHHVKFFGCGAAEPAGANDVGFSLAIRDGYQPHDILFEDCFAWGAGHYKFSVYHGHEIIFRRCIMRFDYVGDTTWPKAGIAIYGSNNVEIQNCLAIDGDTRSLWGNNTNQVDGAFYTPNNSEYSTNVFFRGCMALNWDMPFSGTRGDNVGSATFENCVGWATRSGDSLSRAVTNYDKCTFGNFTNPSSPAFSGYGGSTTMHNSIFYGITTNVIDMYETVDNNCFYDCPTYTPGTNAIIDVDPFADSLLYLPRVEPDSALANAGSDGGKVGAVMLKRIGVSGTLFGQSGYNTVTSEDLWPWPNEDTIKDQMRTYNLHGVNGNRGFCADGQTLTKYIWEYLGNPIPQEIYGGGGMGTPPPEDTEPPVITNVAAGNITSTSATITWTTNELATGTVDYGVTTGYGQQAVEQVSGTAHQVDLSGLTADTGYHYTVSSRDSSGNLARINDLTFTTSAVGGGGSEPVGSTLQNFEDGVVWLPGGSQDPTGNGRGWAFLNTGPGDTIEVDNIGANHTNRSLKITFASSNDTLYFRSDDKITDHFPEAAGANRMSFYVRFPADFPIQPLPFRYDTWQLGTYIHDPNDWSDTHQATSEDDHGIHHYYHRVTMEQVGDGWVKYIITTQPDQANYSGSTVPPNIPYYFDSFGRFYFHFGPEASGPDPGRPFTIWIDEITFYHDDGSVGGQIHVGGQDDAGFDGEFIPDSINGVINPPHDFKMN